MNLQFFNFFYYFFLNRKLKPFKYIFILFCFFLFSMKLEGMTCFVPYIMFLLVIHMFILIM
jgi:hypothetical protein